MRLAPAAARHLAALRALLVFTVLLGLAYPLALVAVAALPGLDGREATLGQGYTTSAGDPLPQYFQSRPSAGGYDPTATGASNLGPESVVDTLASDPDDASPSLLTQVCARSLAVGELEGVSGARPYCTNDGIGAVLGVYRDGGFTGRVTRVVSLNQACPATPFVTTWEGVRVECARIGADHSGAVVTPVRGDAPDAPLVPADAVTASASGLDPEISPAYAALQVPRVARERGTTVAEVTRLVEEHTTGRMLGFLGEPGVDVLGLNQALDRDLPARP
jgi:K+-transporting ATPase ATPase C chain